MNWIVWLMVGTLIGWATSIVTRHPEGVLMDVVLGVSGAILAGVLLAPVLGASVVHAHHFQPASLLVSFVGSLTLVTVATLLRRVAVR
jgi:uncharacterized membrane protein YeaQ/YmgE (transglycosylase-associated protein family)